MGLLDELDGRRERELQDRENSARLAQSHATFVSTGVGTYQNPQRIPFGVTFVERPIVAYGSYVNMDEYVDQMPSPVESSDGPDGDENVQLPCCTGFVTAWDEDDRGFYTGCWVAVRVLLLEEDYYFGGEIQPPPPDIDVEHHFTFAAIGMKDIPVEYDDAVDSGGGIQ